MKIAHISDLHLGKNLLGKDILTYQQISLEKIVSVLVENNIKHLVISGDVFDKSIMPKDSVKIYDKFINILVNKHIKTYIISGNHDSYDKLALYQDLLLDNNIFIAHTFDGTISFYDLDEKTRLYMLPYQNYHEIQPYANEVSSYDEAYKYLMTQVDFEKPVNLLAAHLFMVNNNKKPLQSDSEKQVSVGTLEYVSSKYFRDFDFVLLGHIHKPQKIAENAYYAGSILPYSFSEEHDEKIMMVYDTVTKSVDKVKLYEPYKLKTLKGTFKEMMNYSIENNTFYRLIITDKEEIYNGQVKLESVFKDNLLSIEFLRYSLSGQQDFSVTKNKSLIEYFNDFTKATIDIETLDNDFVKEVIKEARKL